MTMRFALALLAACLAAPVLAQTAPAPAPTPSPAAAPAKPAAPLAPRLMASPTPVYGDPANIWLLDLSDGGRVTITLRPDMAPTMVDRIKTLTRQHFYDGLLFHRVIPGFMAQGGDPKGDGTGGSTLPNVPQEFNALPHARGAVAAARAEDNDSANSQFFIVFSPTLKIDRKYTVFGRVTDGMAYVDGIAPGEPPAQPTRILHAYIASDGPPAYQPPAAAPAPTLPPAGKTVSATPAAVKPARAAPRKR